MVLEDLKSFSWNRPWRPSVWCSVARFHFRDLQISAAVRRYLEPQGQPVFQVGCFLKNQLKQPFPIVKKFGIITELKQPFEKTVGLGVLHLVFSIFLL